VGILYAGIIFFTAAIYGAMVAITGSTRISWVSVGATWPRSPTSSSGCPRATTPWMVSLIVLVAIIVDRVSVLERRVRGVEVVT
jgi:hypothetical protein